MRAGVSAQGWKGRLETAFSCKVRQEDARHIPMRLQTLKCFLSTTETKMLAPVN